nr:Uncharacterised protein [Klebsiella pneumoniae]
MANYPAAYQSTSGSALDVDRDFYKALAEGPRELITSHLIPIRTGFAREVPPDIYSGLPRRKDRR